MFSTVHVYTFLKSNAYIVHSFFQRLQIQNHERFEATNRGYN